MNQFLELYTNMYRSLNAIITLSSSRTLDAPPCRLRAQNSLNQLQPKHTNLHRRPFRWPSHSPLYPLPRPVPPKSRLSRDPPKHIILRLRHIEPLPRRPGNRPVRRVLSQTTAPWQSRRDGSLYRLSGCDALPRQPRGTSTDRWRDYAS